MAIITKLKDTDLLDLQTLFEQSNEDSKTGFEFVTLPDGDYIATVKRFEFKTDIKGKLRASWQFETDAMEGEYANILQFKSDVLDTKDRMTYFLRDVRKFGVEFESLEELLDTLADNVVGRPCIIRLETAELLEGQTTPRQWLNIVVEEEE